MTTNMAEVQTLLARPTPHDNDENLAVVPFQARELPNEKYVALQQDAESQPMDVPAGNRRELDVGPHICTLCWRYETGGNWCRTETGSKSGDSWWRENAPKTAGRRFAMLPAVSPPGTAAKFEETWENLGTLGGRPLATSKV